MNERFITGKRLLALTDKGSKLVAGISGVIGTLADIFSPLAPFAPILFSVSLVLFFYLFFLKVRPALKTEASEIVYSGKPAKIASYSLVSSVIFLLFWGISAQYPNEGVIAANFDGVKHFQERVLGTLDEISEKQDVMLEKQDAVASDVKDIKEIVTGEAEIKQLTSTKDYSTFDEVNVRTDITDQKTIAILYFDNSSGNAQLDALKKGLADMLISDLSNLKMLRVVEREKLEEVMAELKLSSGREFDPATRQKLGKLLGAETILLGSYFDMMGQFRMDARIVKTETGEILKSEGVSGVTADFMKLEKQLVWKIARGLDVRFTEKEEATIMASESVSYEATLIYADGLELYDNGDKPGALEKFKEAVALAPDFNRAKQMIGKLSQS
jgi:TolB-like protein|tara:strand:- start:391 stop:1548 length:1158 start_codon:yes stop_codon:yes gene_type:complete